MKNVWVYAGGLLAITVCGRFTLAAGVKEGPETNAKAAIVACEANLMSFTVFKCRTAITRGSALSTHDGWAGKISDARTCQYVVAVEGDQSRLESMAPRKLPIPTELKDKQGPVVIRVDCKPFAQLRKKALGFEFVAPLGTGYVHRQDEPLPLRSGQPLSYWGAFEPVSLRSPAGHLKECAEGRETMAVGGITRVEGRPAMQVSFTSEWSECQMYFDVQRGHLPLKIVERITKGMAGGRPLGGDRVPVITMHLLEAKEFSRHRWFPIHTITMTVPADPGESVGVIECRVTDLEVDGRISEADLSVDVPAGTTIQWHNDDLVHRFHLRQDEKIRPTDLERLSQMLQDVKTKPLADTAVRQAPRPYKWVWAAVVAVSAICGLVALNRWRRKESGTAGQ